MAQINYTATADLKSYDSWCTSKVDQNASTWDSTTLEGILVLNGNITSMYSAFRNCTDLISINLSGIRTIELFSFANCTNLVSVTFDNSLVIMRQQGNFSGCTSLMNFTLPESLVFLGFESFKNTGWWNSQSNGIVYKDDWCLGYKGSRPTGDITIQNGIKKIISNAFDGCNGITSVNFPNTLQYINSKAFNSCSGLTEITIPESLMDLSQQCFGNCPSMKTLYWNANGENMSRVYNSPWYPNTVIENVILGNTVVNIPGDVFGGFPITEIIIPNSVTSIGEVAFQNCTGLTEVTIPDSVTSIGNSAFSGCTGLNEITLPESLTAINSGVFSNCTSLTEIVIPDSVTSIGNSAFNGCTSLTEINLPKSLTTISSTSTSSSPFNNCSNLTTIYWNSINITSYSSYFNVFNNTPISNIIFGNYVTNIPNSAFYGYTGLTEINLPESLITIGANAFYGCTNLTEIVIPNSVTSIGNSAFQNCTGLTEVTLPESLTTISQDAFRSCTNLTEIVIPNSVTTIGNNAFYGCTELAEVTLPESLTTINGYAFNNCTSLQKIIIPDSVTSIGQGVFNSCSGLTELTLSDSITNIPMYLTQGCTSLTQIIIPNSVTNISNIAFPSQSLIKVACKATTPPTLGSTNNFIASNDTLYVYPDYISTYYSNNSWRNAFTNIKGIYTITTSAGEGGTITPTTEVLEGESFTVTATPNAHYKVSHFVVDGVDVGTVDNYTFQNLDADHTIHVDFELITHTITATAGTGGSISPSGSVIVNDGSDQTFTITPNAGYVIVSVTDNGTSVQVTPSGMTYTISNIQENHTVIAEFVALYTVSTTTTEGGTITPESSTVVAGSDVTLTITPDEGMLIFNVLDNDTPVPVLNPLGMTYTISNIQENHTVEVIFMVAQTWGFNLEEMIDTDFMIQTLEELEERK